MQDRKRRDSLRPTHIPHPLFWVYDGFRGMRSG